MLSFAHLYDVIPRVVEYPDWTTTGEYKEMSLAGIRVIDYEGVDYRGQKTKIFAHIGYPENVTGKAPAIVLVHGGGGHPEDAWIKHWNARGYVAISMDTTGFFPTKPIPHLYEGYAEGLERRLTAPFAEEGYVVAPDNSRMKDGELPVEEQWMYHAVSAVILAHNVLRNDPLVDPDRVGICGISWGGVITTMTIGFDPRFAFAVPIYGSGYLKEGLSDLMQVFKNENVARWRAEQRFERVRMPVMWYCWNDDSCFSVQSNSHSYLETAKNNPNTCLAMQHEMRHSHKHGYRPAQSYWFADAVLAGKKIPTLTATYGDGEVQYACDGAPTAARLFYITEPMTYVQREKYGMKASFMAQEWQIAELDVTAERAPLPTDAVGCYVEFAFAEGVVLTTPYVELKK